MSVVGVTGDSKRVVTIRDNVITGWDPYTGDRAFVVAGSRAGVRSIAMSGDGRLAVSTSFDGTTMEIWKLGLTEATLEESRSGVLWGDVQSISSDNRLAFCCRGKLLTVCELATGALIGSFIADCDFVGLNSFGRKHTLVVSLDGRVVVAGDIAGNIHVLSLTLE
jgi:WD40 repeat protein